MSWTRQLTEYEQPDKELPQDIVMMLTVAAAWLQPRYSNFVRELNEDERLDFFRGQWLVEKHGRTALVPVKRAPR